MSLESLQQTEIAIDAALERNLALLFQVVEQGEILCVETVYDRVCHDPASIRTVWLCRHTDQVTCPFQASLDIFLARRSTFRSIIGLRVHAKITSDRVVLEEIVATALATIR